MTIEPFDGEVWSMKVTLHNPTARQSSPCTFMLSVMVEQLPDQELTIDRMDAQENAVHRAVLDQLRPFLNNSTHVDIGEWHSAVALQDIPVVKRAST